MTDAVLNYLISLISPLVGVLPPVVLILISFRLGRMSMRGLNEQNFIAEVDERVADTISEQMANRVLKPLLQQQQIQLPEGTTAFDLIQRLVEANPSDVNQLTIIYTSLQNLGVNSPFFTQILGFLGLG